MLMKIFCRSLVILLCMFVTAGCVDFFDPNASESEVEAAYGTAYEILEERGDHTLFLEAAALVEDAGLTAFKSKLQGSSLVTVFAPDDIMFATYLAGKYKVQSVAEMATNQEWLEDLEILLGFHMVQYSFRPVDFLSFSVSGNAVVPQFDETAGCYKYLTFSREAIVNNTSPSTGYNYDVFSREKYLTVMSSNLLKDRFDDEATAQKNYELLFPEVWWAGLDDQLYAGNAVVTESGIPALNGYLYIIDNVATPLNTIYDEVHETWAAEYTVFQQLCDRINYYYYDSDITTAYAPNYGDSLHLHYTWMAPVIGSDGSEIAELASEWSAHESDDYDTRMRNTVHCLVPTDRHLEPFILETFAEYFEEEGTEDFVSKLPRNVVYHLLRTFVIDKRDIIFPTELAEGVYGNNGEMFYINLEDVQDVVMCSNGIFYGLDTLITNSIFTSIMKPIMTDPDYQYYANAMTADNSYVQAANTSNEFTIFMMSDDDIYDLSTFRMIDLSEDDLVPDYGGFTFMQGTAEESIDDVSYRVTRNMAYGSVDGIIPLYKVGAAESIETDGRYRYYRTIGWSTDDDERGRFFYTLRGTVYDENELKLNIVDTYDDTNVFDGVNGKIYIVESEFSTATSMPATLIAANEEITLFTQLMSRAGLGTGTTAFLTMTNESMMFIPCDDAMRLAFEADAVPYVELAWLLDEELSEEAGEEVLVETLIFDFTTGSDELLDQMKQQALAKYVRYHFVSETVNGLATPILPGFGISSTASDDSFSEKLITQIQYTGETEIERVTISWEPDDEPNILTLSNYSGRTVVKTKLTGTMSTPLQFSTTGALYVLDGYFDYNTMYEFN